jgi:hypothetical protein
MHIRQLSVQYAAEQDRLLGRLNTSTGEEFRMWFTRRLVRHWWPNLHKALAALEKDRDAAQPLPPQDMARPPSPTRAEMLEKADFSQPYFPLPGVRRPLGEEPLLLTEVHMHAHGGGRLQIGFVERLPGQARVRSVDLQADASLLHALMHLLETGVAQAEWDLALPAEAPADHLLLAQLARPRFLN